MSSDDDPRVDKQVTRKYKKVKRVTDESSTIERRRKTSPTDEITRKREPEVMDNNEQRRPAKKKRKTRKDNYEASKQDDGQGLPAFRSSSEHLEPFPEPKGITLSDHGRKALLYAYNWAHARQEWKFNKANQNWLIRNFWNETAMPPEYTHIAVRYLSSMQGMAKEALENDCMTKAASEEVGDDEHPEMPRARLLLRSLKDSV